MVERLYEIDKLKVLVKRESVFGALQCDETSPAYQEILEAAIAETASEMISVYAEANQTAYNTLVDGGMEINEMSEDQHAEMLKIAEPVYNSVREKIGDEAVDALLNAIH